MAKKVMDIVKTIIIAGIGLLVIKALLESLFL